jgi:hypothetical protein
MRKRTLPGLVELDRYLGGLRRVEFEMGPVQSIDQELINKKLAP